jgi:hypothetical protein
MLSRTFQDRSGRGSVARRLAGVAFVAAIAVPMASCSSTTRTGEGPVYLTITSLQATPGGDTGGTATTKLTSDVVTNGTAFEDLGSVSMVVGQKDITAPLTSNNAVTITRYRVVFKRADGRNAQGADVPYAFDGGVTFTVADTPASATFVLVRAQAKLEPPLVNLRGGGGAIAISTIADVTFYGHDQTGHEVTATGSISVNFADYGDPDDGSS